MSDPHGNSIDPSLSEPYDTEDMGNPCNWTDRDLAYLDYLFNKIA